MSVNKISAPLINPGVCRCCRALKKCRLLTHEYIYMGKLENYSDMFLDCFGLILSHLDGETSEQGVCATCVLRLREATLFKCQVLQCEQDFLKERIIEDNIKCEKEDISINIHSDSDSMANDNDVLAVDYMDDKHKDTRDTVKNESSKQSDDSIDKKDMTDDSDSQVLADIKLPKLLRRSVKKKRTVASPNAIKPLRIVKRKIIKTSDRLDKTLKKAPESLIERPALTIMRKPVEHDTEHMIETNLINLVENSYVCPFSNRFSSYFCFYCHEAFPKAEELRNHTIQHNPKEYKTVFKKRRHPKIDITRIDCRLCDDKINDIATFRNHLEIIHNKHSFDIKDGFLAFRLTNTDLTCIDCGLNFPFFDKLIKHMVEHYGRFTCDVCGQAFLEESSLKTHLLSHSTKKFSCEICCKEFNTKQAKEHHIQLNHSKTPFISCNKCDDLFFNYNERQDHLAQMHGEKFRFACTKCEKSYDKKRSLREHYRRVHLKIKRHKCEFCMERFFTPTLLKDHLTTHTGEKNFSCNYCEKSYPRFKTLQQHIRIHTNDRRYKCHICNSAFIQKVSLKCHMKSHHPEFVLK